MVDTNISHCRCGKVRFEATGDPILAGVCYCDDCQAGGRLIEALPNAATVLDPDGGSSTLVYRDDRWRCVDGETLLRGIKIRDRSPTTRFVASCCNTGMFLKYKRGHWVSAYRAPFDTAPPVQMRTNLRYRNSHLPIPDDAPAYQRFPLALFWLLIKARIAMIFS